MLWTTALGLFLGFWSGLFLLDFYLRAAGANAYIQFAQKTGLIVSPFKIRWYTGNLERYLLRQSFLLHPKCRRCLSIWFNLGTLVAMAAMCIMVVALTRVLLLHGAGWFELDLEVEQAEVVGVTSVGNVPVDVGVPMESYSTATPASLPPAAPQSQPSAARPPSDDSSLGLVPIVPGVNVPWGHVPALVFSLVVATVVHELGHALAAVNDGVQINGFGVFVMAVYPGAFTELSSASLSAQSKCGQLRIYAAGIWHNVVLAAVCYLALCLAPFLAPSCGLLLGNGVLVDQVEHRSGLADHNGGLVPGDVLYAINYCKVRDASSWQSCLHRLSRTHFGYCVPRAEVAAARADPTALHRPTAPGAALQPHLDASPASELDCCPENLTHTHLCFYYRSLRAFSSSNSSKSAAARPPPEQSCLGARHVTEHHVCDRSLPCRAPRTHCVYPALFNQTKLLRFFVANRTKAVLFVGQPSLLVSTVRVRSPVPVSPLGSFLSRLRIVDGLSVLCEYTAALSLALGLLNAVPCYAMDGQFLAEIFSQAACAIGASTSSGNSAAHSAATTSRPATVRRLWQRRLRNGMLVYGTALLVANVVLALWRFAVE